jgi:DNA repair exonuclease SbcCD ATPase subunit
MEIKDGGARLIRAEVQNVLGVRLAEVAFDPDGGMTVVGGANGAGKSSLLDAIRYGIDGVKPKGKDLLRHGAEKGFVRLELAGEVVEVRRGVTAKGTTVKLTGADGAELKKPQGVLDALVGAFGVDPTAFLLLNDEAQAKRVQEVMGVTFDDLDAKRNAAFEERTIRNRRARDAEGELRALPPCERVEPVVVSDLLEQIRGAEDLERAVNDGEREIATLRERKADVEARLEEAEKLVEKLQAERSEIIAKGRARREAINVRAEELKGRAGNGLDAASLRARLSTAEATNAKSAAWERREEARRRLNDAEAAVTDMEGQLAEVDAERAARIAAAPLAIPGVAVVDGAVHWHGKPLSEASDGERLRAAFEIAAAGAPDLRVLFLRHGALLDDRAREAVAELARERGYTVILETVGTAGIDVLVEDGIAK